MKGWQKMSLPEWRVAANSVKRWRSQVRPRESAAVKRRFMKRVKSCYDAKAKRDRKNKDIRVVRRDEDAAESAENSEPLPEPWVAEVEEDELTLVDDYEDEPEEADANEFEVEDDTNEEDEYDEEEGSDESSDEDEEEDDVETENDVEAGEEASEEPVTSLTEQDDEEVEGALLVARRNRRGRKNNRNRQGRNIRTRNRNNRKGSGRKNRNNKNRNNKNRGKPRVSKKMLDLRRRRFCRNVVRHMFIDWSRSPRKSIPRPRPRSMPKLSRPAVEPMPEVMPQEEPTKE